MPAEWLGRPILDKDDYEDLEQRAAIHQFHHNIPRHEAEDKAYEDYRLDKITDAAAHHLKSLKSAHAVGDMEIAKKHGIMYRLALKELKHDDHLNPPPDVVERHKNMGEDLHRFRAHKGDFYLLPKDKDKN